MSANAVDVGAVVELLSRQRDLYAQLKVMADAQRTAITGNEPEKLLGVLAERQRILDQSEQIAERLRAFQRDWPTLRRQMTSGQSQQIDALLADVNGLLKSILATDQADGELLAAHKGATAQELATVRTGQQAGAAYVAAAYHGTNGRDWTTQ